jgi:hypothetical protein
MELPQRESERVAILLLLSNCNLFTKVLVVFLLAKIDTMEKMSPKYPVIISWIHVMIASVNKDKGEKKMARPCLERMNLKHRNRKNTGIEVSCFFGFL